jgi:hypothetical protein
VRLREIGAEGIVSPRIDLRCEREARTALFMITGSMKLDEPPRKAASADLRCAGEQGQWRILLPD